MPRDSYHDDYNSHDSRYRDYPRNDYPPDRQGVRDPPSHEPEARPGHPSFYDQLMDELPPRPRHRRHPDDFDEDQDVEADASRGRRHDNYNGEKGFDDNPPPYTPHGDTRSSQRTADPRERSRPRHSQPKREIIRERPPPRKRAFYLRDVEQPEQEWRIHRYPDGREYMRELVYTRADGTIAEASTLWDNRGKYKKQMAEFKGHKRITNYP